jgi:predicted dehydrogenase
MTIRIGVIGLSHDHVWDNLPLALKHKDIEVVAVADVNESLLNKAQKLANCAVHRDPQELLDRDELDGVYLFGSNSESAQWGIRAANRGLPMLIEKPLAARRGEAERLVAAAYNNNVPIVVNWPFAWWPQLQHALRIVDEGAIGDVWQVKYRAAHAGPKELGCSDHFCNWLFDPQLNGGGALIDYCCYGCLLARTIMGMPSRVTGIVGRFQKQGITVEDNAMVVMEYSHGMATAEGSWTQIGKLTAYTTAFYGTTGTLLVEPRFGGRLLLADDASPEGREIEVPDPDVSTQNSANQFVHCVQTGESPQPLCDSANARDVQHMLSAAQRSASLGQSVSLPLPV